MRTLLTLIFPLVFVAIAFSVRPLPLRVNASDPAERVGQHCLRVSFLLLLIPAIVMGATVALLIHRFSGGPGLDVYRNFFSVSGKAWKISSVAGILSGAAGSIFPKGRSQGYELIVVHVILLFLVIVVPELQYGGHPD